MKIQLEQADFHEANVRLAAKLQRTDIVLVAALTELQRADKIISALRVCMSFPQWANALSLLQKNGSIADHHGGFLERASALARAAACHTANTGLES